MDESHVKNLLQRSAGIDVLVELVKIDPMRLDSSGRIDFLAALEKQSGWLHSLMQVAIVAVAGVEPSEDQGKYSNVDDPQREEIASTLNLAPITAQSRIDIARTLTQHLPATCIALANGEISSNQASVIARESAELLRKGIDPADLKYLEATAISYSEFHTPAQLTNKVRSMIAKLEPQEFESAVEQAHRGRRVTLTVQPHGMSQILALLPAVEAQTIWLAINKLARIGNRDDKNSERELVETADAETLSIDQRRADALAAIAERYLATSETENQAHGRPVTLNLTLDLPTFLGLKENPGILEGFGEIPASAARILASDAKWKRFITDPLTGNLLDFGRSTYEPPQALVDFITARDRRCRFPGCRQPSQLCDIDHAIPWEDGGETSTDNLGLLCRRHHRRKTHGGWSLTSFPDGSCEWRSPLGKIFKVSARPVNEIA